MKNLPLREFCALLMQALLLNGEPTPNHDGLRLKVLHGFRAHTHTHTQAHPCSLLSIVNTMHELPLPNTSIPRTGRSFRKNVGTCPKRLYLLNVWHGFGNSQTLSLEVGALNVGHQSATKLALPHAGALGREYRYSYDGACGDYIRIIVL